MGYVYAWKPAPPPGHYGQVSHYMWNILTIDMPDTKSCTLDRDDCLYLRGIRDATEGANDMPIMGDLHRDAIELLRGLEKYEQIQVTEES